MVTFLDINTDAELDGFVLFLAKSKERETEHKDEWSRAK